MRIPVQATPGGAGTSGVAAPRRAAHVWRSAARVGCVSEAIALDVRRRRMVRAGPCRRGCSIAGPTGARAGSWSTCRSISIRTGRPRFRDRAPAPARHESVARRSSSASQAGGSRRSTRALARVAIRRGGSFPIRSASRPPAAGVRCRTRRALVVTDAGGAVLRTHRVRRRRGRGARTAAGGRRSVNGALAVDGGRSFTAPDRARCISLPGCRMFGCS